MLRIVQEVGQYADGFHNTVSYIRADLQPSVVRPPVLDENSKGIFNNLAGPGEDITEYLPSLLKVRPG